MRGFQNSHDESNVVVAIFNFVLIKILIDPVLGLVLEFRSLHVR